MGNTHPSPDGTRAPKSETMSWSGCLPALLSTSTYTRLFRHGTSTPVHRDGPIHPHIDSTIAISARGIYRDVPCSSHCRASPTPPSAPWILLEAQRGSQPSTEHAGVSSEHAACTQHTQSSRWVSSGLGPERRMDTAHGSNWSQVPPASGRAAGQAPCCSQHVPWSARACSKRRWEEEGMENRQDLSQSPQTPADCSRVSPKAKALHFSVNKVGIQLC